MVGTCSIERTISRAENNRHPLGSLTEIINRADGRSSSPDAVTISALPAFAAAGTAQNRNEKLLAKLCVITML